MNLSKREEKKKTTKTITAYEYQISHSWDYNVECSNEMKTFSNISNTLSKKEKVFFLVWKWMFMVKGMLEDDDDDDGKQCNRKKFLYAVPLRKSHFSCLDYVVITLRWQTILECFDMQHLAFVKLGFVSYV